MNAHCVKMSMYGIVSGPDFPAFGLNKERYSSVSLRIQSECGKIRTRKNSVFGQYSRIVYFWGGKLVAIARAQDNNVINITGVSTDK